MQLPSFESYLIKQKLLKAQFQFTTTPDQRYEKIIDLGRTLAPYPVEARHPQNLVKGCQSLMYLHATPFEKNKISFYADSEALISRGLAALLISIYNEEPPEIILTCPPSVLEELEIRHLLSPGRSNGLFSLMNRMKQEALQLYTQEHSKSK